MQLSQEALMVEEHYCIIIATNLTGNPQGSPSALCITCNYLWKFTSLVHYCIIKFITNSLKYSPFKFSMFTMWCYMMWHSSISDEDVLLTRHWKLKRWLFHTVCDTRSTYFYELFVYELCHIIEIKLTFYITLV